MVVFSLFSEISHRSAGVDTQFQKLGVQLLRLVF